MSIFGKSGPLKHPDEPVPVLYMGIAGEGGGPVPGDCSDAHLTCPPLTVSQAKPAK